MSLLEDARALLATGAICDHCLGRPFADRSFGLSNAERGESLRVAVAMADDRDFEPGAGEDCWVCEGHCARHEEWAERVADAAADHDFETYQVGTRVPPLVEENDRLLREDAGLDPEAGEPFKAAFNREVGKRVGALTGAVVDFERPDVLALLNVERGDVDLQVNPAFVYGRYRKLERGVPQTEWPCDDCGGSGTQFDEESGETDCEACDGSGYAYPTSVEQEVAPPVREAMAGEEALFHGAGREDVDALMLGTGRPFVVEVKQPRERSPDLDAVAEAIHAGAGGDDGATEDADGPADADSPVEVEGLRLATYESVERVKELDASKRYRAEVALEAAVDPEEFADALAELDGATVEQYTPRRVDHRRASTTRERTVYEIEGELEDPLEEPLDADEAAAELEEAPAPDYDASRGEGPALDAIAQRGTVELHGEGGLYVKELLHGDDGRTEPSLAGLLDADLVVTALDVLAVEGEDEPFEVEDYFRD